MGGVPDPLRRVCNLNLFANSNIAPQSREPSIEWKPVTENEYIHQWKAWWNDRGKKTVTPPTNEITATTTTTANTAETVVHEIITISGAASREEDSNNYTIVHNTSSNNNNNHSDDPDDTGETPISATGNADNTSYYTPPDSPLISLTSFSPPPELSLPYREEKHLQQHEELVSHQQSHEQEVMESSPSQRKSISHINIQEQAATESSSQKRSIAHQHNQEQVAVVEPPSSINHQNNQEQIAIKPSSSSSQIYISRTNHQEQETTESSLLQPKSIGHNNDTHPISHNTHEHDSSMDGTPNSTNTQPPPISAVMNEVIFSRATDYQLKKCKETVELVQQSFSDDISRNNSSATDTSRLRYQFEEVLNILNHPDSEIIQDNHTEQINSSYESVRRSGKTFLLFELLKRVSPLSEPLDIAIFTENQNTETVIYNLLRSNGYPCERIPAILEDNWTKGHGVFLTTEKDNLNKKWQSRPSIDIIFVFDIRILATDPLFSKMDGDKRTLWMVSKSTVEEHAFITLSQEAEKLRTDDWKEIWRQSEPLQRVLFKLNSGIGLDTMEVITRQSVARAIPFLFRSATLFRVKRTRHTIEPGDDMISVQPTSKRICLTMSPPSCPTSSPSHCLPVAEPQDISSLQENEKIVTNTESDVSTTSSPPPAPSITNTTTAITRTGVTQTGTKARSIIVIEDDDNEGLDKSAHMETIIPITTPGTVANNAAMEPPSPIPIAIESSNNTQTQERPKQLQRQEGTPFPIEDVDHSEGIQEQEERVAGHSIDMKDFECRTVNVINQLLEYPKKLNLERKDKEISRVATLSREFKETATTSETSCNIYASDPTSIRSSGIQLSH
ncbi:hypothetical protein BDA99DRAFT_279456 [Phascolomyces articulosus]|uniref:Uncharacterized protein n=1 Tax=Phascolomyces articulosus TaxID=60185 RepID=A0AAD5KPL0_9FUNG|nr:hypothetical protein BDA99DRAFT_279456 [Phascolomyces articulosus]